MFPSPPLAASLGFAEAAGLVPWEPLVDLDLFGLGSDVVELGVGRLDDESPVSGDNPEPPPLLLLELCK